MQQSLCELMERAFQLSLKCVYETMSPDGHCLEERKCDLPDFVVSWADGLYHVYYQKIAEGRTSIQEQIDFDIGKFEEKVEHDIVKMEKLLTSLGPPRLLTVAEYREKGYRGPIAGYTPVEDTQFYLQLTLDGLARVEKTLAEYEALPKSKQDWGILSDHQYNVKEYREAVEIKA